MSRPAISSSHRTLYVAAAIFTGVLIASGGVVCMTNSSSGCPDWPGCYGRVIPPLAMKSIIEWTHRTVAAFALPLLLVGAVIGWRKYGAHRWLSRVPALSILFLLAVAGFGAWGVFWYFPRWAAAADLSCALITLGLVVTTAVVAVVRHAHPDRPEGMQWRAPGARLGRWTVLALFALFVAGVLVAEQGSVVRCFGLPFWGADPKDADYLWWYRARMAFGVGVIALLLVLARQTWARAPRLAATVAGLLAAEVAVGFWLTARGLTDLALVVYVLLAAALWAFLVALVARIALPDSDNGADA